jgi:cell division transport system ATP-binding protein
LNDPDLILADEPTGNLDPKTSLEVMELLTDIHKSGKSILMATHDYALIVKSGNSNFQVHLQEQNVRFVRLEEVL